MIGQPVVSTPSSRFTMHPELIDVRVETWAGAPQIVGSRGLPWVSREIDGVVLSVSDAKGKGDK